MGRDILGTNLDIFWPIQATFVAGEPLCDVGGIPILSFNSFTQDHLLKIGWLVTNLTAVKSPGRAERCYFGGAFGGDWG